MGFEAKTNLVAQAPGTDDKPGDVVDVDRARVQGLEYLDAGLPFCMSVSPWRMLIEPGPDRLDAAAWVCNDIFVAMSVIQVDPRFARFKDQLKPSHRILPRSDGPDEVGQRDADPLGYCKFHEICDRDARRVLWVPAKETGLNEIVDELAWPEGIEGFPYVRVAYEDEEGYFYPNPPLGVTHDLNTGTDALFTRMVESTEGSRTVIAYDPDKVAEEDIARMSNARDQEFVPIKGLTDHVKVIQFPGASGDVQAMFETTKRLADELNGIGEFQRAVAPSTPRASATEISAAMNAQGVRMDDLRGAVYEATSKAIGMIGALLIVHADLMADITLPAGKDPTGENRFVALGPGVVGEYLDYAYEVVTTAVEKVDPAIRQKRTQDLIGQSMDPNLTAKLQQEGKLFLTAPLVERQLKDIGETDPEVFFRDLPQSDPAVEQQAAQQEDAIMVRTGEVLPVSPGEDHQTHLQVHGADYQSSGSEAIAAHAAMHEQYLAAAQPDQGGGAAGGESPGTGTAGAAQQAGALQAQAG